MKPKSIAQLVVAVALLSGAFALFYRSSNARRIDFDPYRALGDVAADETAALLGGRGDLVLVLPDEESSDDPVLTAQVKAYRGGVSRHSGLRIAAVEVAVMDPFLRMRTGGALPAEQFTALRHKHASAAAFVLFLGFPALPQDELEVLEKSPVKLIAISAALPDYPTLLSAGLLDLAIVPRTTASAAAQPGGSAGGAREIFDREYEVLRGAPAPKAAP